MPCEVVPCAFGVSLLFMTELRAMQRRLEKMDHWRASDFGKKKINGSCITIMIIAVMIVIVIIIYFDYDRHYDYSL